MESLSEFGERLKSKANTLDVVERQKILRLLVKEVLVNNDSFTIRHSIPLPQVKKEGTILPIPEPQLKKTEKSYLLSSGSIYSALRNRFTMRRIRLSDIRCAKNFNNHS